MGLWDKLRGELIDIIEWTDDSNDTLVWRFERYDNEIKNGAQLTVREGQVACFVNEGQLADVFQPGRYELKTENLPILSTLKGWKHGFSSPFKAEVYFVSTRQFTDQKWGTKNPIMLRDPDFGVLRLRAFGSYAFRVEKADVFLKEIVGTDGHFTLDEISDQLRNLVVSRFPDALGESKVAALDLAANYNELGDTIGEGIGQEFAELGLELTKMLIENISLPEEVEKALDARSSMGVLGNMQQYTQFQAANSIPIAAGNEGMGGGFAAAGMGAGMGMAMGAQMQQAMAPGAGAPPPPPPAAGGLSYYMSVNGQQHGPYPVTTLQQYAQQGNFTAQTQVWAQGMSGWLPAAQVPELASLFQSAPPPPPPAPGATPPPPPPPPAG